jgi:hypothetical protein
MAGNFGQCGHILETLRAASSSPKACALPDCAGCGSKR